MDEGKGYLLLLNCRLLRGAKQLCLGLALYIVRLYLAGKLDAAAYEAMTVRQYVDICLNKAI